MSVFICYMLSKPGTPDQYSTVTSGSKSAAAGMSGTWCRAFDRVHCTNAVQVVHAYMHSAFRSKGVRRHHRHATSESIQRFAANQQMTKSRITHPLDEGIPAKQLPNDTLPHRTLTARHGGAANVCQPPLAHPTPTTVHVCSCCCSTPAYVQARSWPRPAQSAPGFLLPL
jgi:hypothetical protein